MRISDWSSDVCSSDLYFFHKDEGDEAKYTELRKYVLGVIADVLPAELLTANTVYHINPTGRFEIGGPDADAGLTGRKIIVATYGGASPHGGGAFSGKDPTKVDRSVEHTSELQSLLLSSYAVFCLQTTNNPRQRHKSMQHT